MKRLLGVFLATLVLLFFCGCGPAVSENEEEEGGVGVTDTTDLYLYANGEELVAQLSDNSSARALAELLRGGPLTIEMRDLAGFEKVGPLGQTLPRNDESLRTKAGDLVLYQGNQFVIYYGENNWSLTLLGRIEGATREGLLSVLGEGDVRVVLSLERMN